MTLGVVTEAASPSDVLKLSAKQMAKVIRALHDLGVAPEDVRTTGLNLMAQYTHKEREAPILRGYQVRNNIFVTVRKLDELGSVLRAGVEAGANHVGGLNLSARDMQEAHSNARRAAVEAMMAKAEEYARLMARNVKALKSVVENPGIHRPDIMARGGGMVGGYDGGMSTGDLSVRIDVEGIFELD